MIKKIFSIPGLIVLVLILVAAYIALWMGLRSVIVSGVTNSITNLESEGYRVEHGGLAISGFPFSIDASSPNISVRTTPNSAASINGNWSIETDKLDVSSATLTPLSWSLGHNGKLGVDIRANDGTRYKFDVTPANIDADAAYGLSGQLKSIRANMSNAQINPRLGTEAAVLGLAGLNVDIKVNDGTGHVDLLGENIVMSQQALGVAYNVLGQNISRLSLKGQIENWPLLETEGLEFWLQSPAKIKTEDWQLLWGNADVVGSFDLGFNNNLPEGVLRFRIKNIEVVIQSLIEMNLIESSFAQQLSPVIGTIETDEDGRKSIEITIRDGVVKYGFFTLFRL